MKKQGRKKLTISRHTLRALSPNDLDDAAGALQYPTISCLPSNCCGAATFNFSGCWTCVQQCFSQDYSRCCLSPPSDYC
jgi:hypothetical protein